MACPGCAAVPIAQDVGDASPDDILLNVPDIHCVACIRTVEAALNARSDVKSVRVNLTLKRAYVTPAKADVSAQDLCVELERAGFAAHVLDAHSLGQSGSSQEGQRLLARLAIAGFAAMNVMLLSVAVWSGASDSTRDLFHWVSAVITLPAIVYVAHPFWSGAWRALRAGHLNMDVPIALAIVLALATSLWETWLGGEHAYFDAALTLCFFLLVGRYLEFRARAAACSAAKELTALEVPRALRMENDAPVDVAISDLSVGDTVLVRPGGRMPVDGVVLDGRSDIDRSFLTGESQPVCIQTGADVHAGEVNLSAPLTLRVTAIGTDTTLHQLVDLVAVAEAGRSRYTPLAEKAAALYAPGVHILSLLSFLGWYFWTYDLRTALNIAAAVLIITCPCALGLAVPAVTTAASGWLFRKGFLIKSATALERLAQVDTVVFDKTGTLTEGTPRLVNSGDVPIWVQEVALALASGSDHPVSRAIAHAFSVAPASVSNRREIAGYGTEARWESRTVRLGRSGWAGPDTSDGFGAWIDCGNGQPIWLKLTDRVRTGAKEAVTSLREAGLTVWMVSGDSNDPVAKIAETLGIDQWTADCLPHEKAAFVQDLDRSCRRVLMVGDGLNDTAALAAAHVSISPASGLDAARAASDIVLLNEGLGQLTDAVLMARRAKHRILQNFRIATAYNLIAVPLAVAGLATPLIAALAMSSSSIAVSLNALRLKPK